MTDPLPRLLASYEFLNLALADHSGRMAAPDARRLKKERDLAFLEILTHGSSEVRVTIAQLRFILSNLDHLTGDPGVLPDLQAACARHLDRIAAYIATNGEERAGARKRPQLSAREPGGFSSSNFAVLDELSDRVGVFDPEYRYVFTNAANARFHDRPASEFVGQPKWAITGRPFFERVIRPLMDRALLGHSGSCITPCPGRDPSKIYSAAFDPVHDKAGKVVGVLVISRDISHLPVPGELIAEQP